ncbi:MAG: hypothetical protein WAM85_22565 [Terracidiphilus sp.]
MSQGAKQDAQGNDEEMRPEYDFSKGLRGVHAYRFSKLSSDEALVLGYWQKEGFEIDGFANNEMRDLKTPDFRLSRNGVEVAYCEVKSFEKDNWLEDQIRQVPPGQIAGGLRPDPIFNRISNAIHTAFKQFERVNSDRRLLNFLFLVNHDTSARPEDLDRVLTGLENPRKGTLDPTCVQFSQGWVFREKGKIDLYVWLDSHDGQIRSSEYRVLGNPDSRQWVCGLLGIEPSRVRNIPSAA